MLCVKIYSNYHYVTPNYGKRFRGVLKYRKSNKHPLPQVGVKESFAVEKSILKKLLVCISPGRQFRSIDRSFQRIFFMVEYSPGTSEQATFCCFAFLVLGCSRLSPSKDSRPVDRFGGKTSFRSPNNTQNHPWIMEHIMLWFAKKLRFLCFWA